MKKIERDIYEYPSLRALMKDVRESYTLMELAKPVGVSHERQVKHARCFPCIDCGNQVDFSPSSIAGLNVALR